MHRFAVLLGAFSLGLGAARAQEDAPRYSVTEIPFGAAFSALPAGDAFLRGMNNKQQVVGIYSHNDIRGFAPFMRLWVYLPEADYGLAAGFHVLSTPGKRIESACINDQGLIGGTVSNQEDGNQRLSGFTINVDGSGYSEFYFTGAPDDSQVYGIANGGFLCGEVSLTLTGQPRPLACLKNPDVHTLANPSNPAWTAQAVAINSQGKAVLRLSTGSTHISGLYDGLSYTLFTPPPGPESSVRSHGCDINEKNEVVGHHFSPSGSATPSTFLYLPLPAYGLSAGYHVLPIVSEHDFIPPALNDHGLITADKVIWHRGTVYPIARILPPETTGINAIGALWPDNTGAILAYRSDQPDSFLMLLPEEMEIITVNDDRDLRDHDPDDGLLDVDPDKEGEQITLRAAIDYANKRLGKQRIVFDIPGGGIPTIQVGLPPEGENVMATGDDPRPLDTLFDESKVVSSLKVTSPVEIDGSTQPGGWVEITGRDATDALKIDASRAEYLGVNGLEITAGNCLVRGLVINRFYGVGLVINGGGGNRIVGNRIGTDPSGSIRQGNEGRMKVWT